MKIELHVHTKESNDSLMPFWALYIKCRMCRINCIAITEHNNIDGGLGFKEFCRKHGNYINVIVGEEIFSNKGEIIGLFLKEPIQSGLTPAETIHRIKAQGGVVYIPHPYDEKRNKSVLEESEIDKNKKYIDCIEIHNGRNVSQHYDEMQKMISLKYNIRPIIGSDAHTIWEVGRNYMVNKDEYEINDKDTFVYAIEHSRMNSSECIMLAHIITKVEKVIKMVLEGRINELFHIVNKRYRRKK